MPSRLTGCDSGKNGEFEELRIGDVFMVAAASKIIELLILINDRI
jgi:hypothetical protein